MNKVAQKVARFVGLDVHAATIAVAVAEAGGEVRSLGTVQNEPESVRKLVKRLNAGAPWRACYEAGPTGYVLHRQLLELGVDCIVVAPTLVPMKAGDRVKTDRRDAEKLARALRAGDLTAVWVPDDEHEALRDLVRARRAAKDDQRRARHRLQKMLLRLGCRPPSGTRSWSERYMTWIKNVTFPFAAQQAAFEDYRAEVEHANSRLQRLEQRLDEAIEHLPAKMRAVVDALQTLRGVAKLSALTLVAELGELSRFAKARQLMSYAGVVAREHSSGSQVRRGHITKSGNAHVRHIVTEAAWSYRHRPSRSRRVQQAELNQSAEVTEIAWKAQQRLHRRYRRLLERGKNKQQTVTAVGRELLGFIWAIATRVERAA